MLCILMKTNTDDLDKVNILMILEFTFPLKKKGGEDINQLVKGIAFSYELHQEIL